MVSDEKCDPPSGERVPHASWSELQHGVHIVSYRTYKMMTLVSVDQVFCAVIPGSNDILMKVIDR